MRTIIIIAFNLLLASSSLASERTDSIVREDSEIILDSLQARKNDMREFKADLKNMERHIINNRIGNTAYLKFDKIAGSVLIVAVVIGSYKAHFPPGFRAMLSAYTTVTGLSKGMIKLSERDMKIFLSQVKLLREKIKIAENNVALQVKHYCSLEDVHQLCRP